MVTELEIRPAMESEFPLVRDFYYALIDDMESEKYPPGWKKGIYPENSYIKDAVLKGTLHIGVSDGKIVSAMVLNDEFNPGYNSASWDDINFSVIHILGVSPRYAGKGVGSAMIKRALEISKKRGKAAVRLDVLIGNIPAVRLYEKNGFKYVDTIKLFYEDTGLAEFELYEYRV